ncbi:MAG TPA: hypothetical protein VLA31_07365, partial [Burkholderiaceae bacterium]|nr:hypothetical protein [Burkholderiaceae bacterium]
MAADNPSMPNPAMAAGVPVPMGVPNGANPGGNNGGADAGNGSVAANAAQAATQAASQAGATIAGGVAGVKRTIESLPVVQNSPTLKMVRDALNQPSVKKAVPGLIAFFVLVLFLSLYSMMQAPPTPQRALMPGISETDQQLAMEALKMASFDAKIDPTTGQIMVPGDKYHEARI